MPRSWREPFSSKYERRAGPLHTKCWIWIRSPGPTGYGQVRHAGRMQKAHRVAWLLHRGPIPNGLWVLHKCDVPLCVNPGHLYLGTHQNNVRDMWARGRGSPPPHAVGEANSRRVMSDKQERQVLKLRRAGATYRAIAERFGVSVCAIGGALRRQGGIA